VNVERSVHLAEFSYAIEPHARSIAQGVGVESSGALNVSIRSYRPARAVNLYERSR
jgi:hypothetical protein